jgi:hypothetical protein
MLVGPAPTPTNGVTVTVPAAGKLQPAKVISPFTWAVPPLMPENVAEALVLDPDTWAIEGLYDVQPYVKPLPLFPLDWPEQALGLLVDTHIFATSGPKVAVPPTGMLAERVLAPTPQRTR